jgi:hypothetical protein
MNSTKIKIQTGIKDDVTVIADLENQRYIVDMPNSYDIYWTFNSKNEQHSFAKRIEQADMKRAMYEIPLDSLSSLEKVKNLNFKIAEARNTAKEIASERETMESVLSFDHAHDGKTVAFIYKAPTKGFAVGEILHSGKFFVAQTAGESDEKVFIRVIHSIKLLQGKDEFTNREEALKSKFPTGSLKYLRYDEQGKITAQDYQPKQRVGNEPAKLTGEQRTALKLFSEKNGNGWKEKLNIAWTSGSYKGIDRSQSALLQQVRNQFGPEWLISLDAGDLYRENVQTVPMIRAKTTGKPMMSGM